MSADWRADTAAGDVHPTDANDGSIRLVPDAGAPVIDTVGVATAAEGHGLGTAPMRFVEAVAKPSGVVTFRLRTDAAMTANLASSARLGFAETRRAAAGGLARVLFERQVRGRRRSAMPRGARR